MSSPQIPPKAPFHLLAASLLVGMSLTLGATGCNKYGEKLTFKEGELYYKKPVKKATAKKVGSYLVDVGYLKKKKKKSVQIRKKGDTYQLRFVVKNPNNMRAGTKEQFKILGGMLSRYTLDGAKVEVHLCNRRLKTKKTISVPKGMGDFGSRLAFDKGEIFYKDPVEEAVAKKLGEYLKKKGFFNDKKRKSVQITKASGGGYDIRFVVKRGAPKRAVETFKKLGKLLEQQVTGGEPVKIHFCDATMKIHTSL